MHPRERGTTRRRFLLSSGGALATLSGADALLRAAGALAAVEGVPIGPGGIPLARRGHPVTLPLYGDNHPIDSGLSPEKGPLRIFNWSDYVNPKVLRDFGKQYGVKVSVTTFQNEEEAVAKLISGRAHFDLWFATVDYLSRAVAGKLIQPLQHSYLGNLQKSIWPSLANPFYDTGSRYSVPYTVYTTGIAWRKDKVKKGPTSYANPYDVLWQSGAYKGKVAILDDQREALAMALLRRHVTDVNTESSKLVQRAGADLSELTKLANVRTNVTDYQDVPAGTTWLSQAWSGDMAGAPNYMPKGVPVSVIGY
jgi:spermidine/putrescine transport system substrate-binding protein